MYIVLTRSSIRDRTDKTNEQRVTTDGECKQGSDLGTLHQNESQLSLSAARRLRTSVLFSLPPERLPPGKSCCPAVDGPPTGMTVLPSRGGKQPPGQNKVRAMRPYAWSGRNSEVSLGNVFESAALCLSAMCLLCAWRVVDLTIAAVVASCGSKALPI